jgi:two-component system NarL family response regulator
MWMADPYTDGSYRAERPLTMREREILALVAAGDSTRAISEQLGIAPGTVKVHLTSIYRKLRVRNRVQAARYYVERLVP